MAAAAGGYGNGPVIGADKNRIPAEILNDSVLVHLAAAYFSVAKRLDQKTHCSQTRGFIMSTLRRGAERNQNQIAVLLGFDRTVVHRAIKSMIREGLASQKKAKSGKALLIQLTAKGNKYRERLIKERRAAEEKLRTELTSAERPNLLRLLKLVSELKF